MVIGPLPTVRLHGRPGQLRRVTGEPVPPVPGSVAAAAGGAGNGPTGVDLEPRWIWEGALDGPGLATLMRTALVHGMVPCELDGRPHRARATGCWYDAGHGTVIVELAGMPEPIA